MIGNDVVDLALAKTESNWQRRGFLDKLFTVHEQDIIYTAADNETMVWTLWSMKESAYKIYNRVTGIRSFNPTQFCCDTNGFYGRVSLGSRLYHTKTFICNDRLHTVAALHETHLERIIEVDKSAVRKDSMGLPYMSAANNAVIPVSKSHHGRFEKVVSIHY